MASPFLPPDSKDSLRSVTEAEWVELLNKLRLHTRLHYGGFNQIAGEDLDDIVHQAVADTLNNQRRWPVIDKNSGRLTPLPLFHFLCGTIRSLISHHWRKNRRTISLNGLPPAEHPPHRGLEVAIRPSDQFVNPDGLDGLIDARHFVDQILRLVARDPEASQIVITILADPDLRPREIARELHMTMPQMQAAQKRLRRLLRNALKRNTRLAAH